MSKPISEPKPPEASPASVGSSSKPATKQDLTEMESRLMIAIHSANQISFLDQHALNALIVRSKRIVIRLAALDAKTTPK